jgi:mannose-6-phosphate isomerase-like protein (cupin superfamily)
LITCTAKRLSLPLPENKTSGWVPYHLFRGPTPSLAFMTCHVSVLSPGHCPHPPHSHIEEELLIILDGEGSIEIAANRDDASPRVEMLIPGQFSYYPAWQHHTIRNRSTRPVTYMMFKWTGTMPGRIGGLPAGIFDYRSQLAAEDARAFAPSTLLKAQPAGSIGCTVMSRGSNRGSDMPRTSITMTLLL